MRYAKVDRCDDGRLPDDIYRTWRISRCATCGVYVLPLAVRYLDYRWLTYATRRAWRSARNR